MAVYVQKRQGDDAIVIRMIGRGKPSSTTGNDTIQVERLSRIFVRADTFGDEIGQPKNHPRVMGSGRTVSFSIGSCEVGVALK